MPPKRTPAKGSDPQQTLDAIPDEDFVEVWQATASLADLAKALGTTPRAASTRAAVLRRAGVPLKVFRRGSQIDVERLAAIARRHARP